MVMFPRSFLMFFWYNSSKPGIPFDAEKQAGLSFELLLAKISSIDPIREANQKKLPSF